MEASNAREMISQGFLTGKSNTEFTRNNLIDRLIYYRNSNVSQCLFVEGILNFSILSDFGQVAGYFQHIFLSIRFFNIGARYFYEENQFRYTQVFLNNRARIFLSLNLSFFHLKIRYPFSKCPLKIYFKINPRPQISLVQFDSCQFHARRK